jgi:hypothetical protein
MSASHWNLRALQLMGVTLVKPGEFSAVAVWILIPTEIGSYKYDPHENHQQEWIAAAHEI